jgi:RNA-directed DNA polymerase
MLRRIYINRDKYEDLYYTKLIKSKKKGGIRRIYAPCPKLKAIQREIADKLNEEVSFADYVTGFVPGRSIFDNAKIHLHAKWVVNLDIKDFFPSLRKQKIRFITDQYNIDPDLIFHPIKEYLVQGSPCSPVISNVCLKLLDEHLNSWGYECGFKYSRYCDDITFSTKLDMPRMVVGKFTGLVIDNLEFNRFTINDKKTRITDNSQRQVITGIVINNGKLGIDKKTRNKLRAKLNYFKKNGMKLDDNTAGYLNFVKDTNPDQYNKLLRSYIV